MSIDYDSFLKWCESRFDDIVVKGNEIKLNSIFCEDYKHHLWCNPSGGKTNCPNGVFHCWKTDRCGSLVTLVMLKDKCSYEEAIEILGGSDISLEELEKELEKIFNKREEITLESKITLPDGTYRITELPEDDLYKIEAEVYLKSRKIPVSNLMVCTSGDYRRRIVIPYYDKNGKLIYYNSRYIGDSKKIPKYMGPPKEIGVGKSEVLYFEKWPDQGETICLTEGEFDSIVLNICEYPSGACGGKLLSEIQLGIILSNKFNVILCLDNDNAGKMAIKTIGNTLHQHGGVSFVVPPNQFKDWNTMYQNLSKVIVHEYIRAKIKKYDPLEYELGLK